jgi:hypothetical protein
MSSSLFEACGWQLERLVLLRPSDSDGILASMNASALRSILPTLILLSGLFSPFLLRAESL